MIDQLLEALRRETSGERALDSVRAIARFHRIQASPGYERAAEWLAARLESYGLVPEIERVPGDGRTRFLGQLMPEGWECTGARATLIDASGSRVLCDAAAEALSVVQRSAPVRGRFPLVAVAGGGDPAHYQGVDVRGRVVLVRDAVHDAHRLAVLERGAAGLLSYGRRLLPQVRDRFEDPDQVAYTSFWWAGDEPRGSGFVVSPRVGVSLHERLARGERLELDVDLESRRFATTIPLVSARLPGASGREALVLSHLCHPQPSANDNASGAAAALEAARVLTTLANRGALPPLARGVRFLWMPELTGTLAWLGQDPERAARIVAAVNLDMVGEDQERCGSTFLIERPPCFAASFAETLMARVRRAALDWMVSYSGPGHVPATRIAEVPYGGGSDHAVLVDPAIGVPCPMLIQWPDRYYHSSHDTPEKCDPRSLALAARCAATYAGFLATAGPAEIDWLSGLVAREARRRVLEAADETEPSRAVARERLRGGRALASLERLDVSRDATAEALRDFEAFVDRECASSRAASASASAEDAIRPVRRQGGMLDFQRHLIAGWDALPVRERDAWRALERSVPDGGVIFDLAWFACDGRRSLAEIDALVRLETGRSEPGALRAFFEWTERLGISAWNTEDAACSTSPRDTASP